MKLMYFGLCGASRFPVLWRRPLNGGPRSRDAVWVAADMGTHLGDPVLGRSTKEECRLPYSSPQDWLVIWAWAGIA